MITVYGTYWLLLCGLISAESTILYAIAGNHIGLAKLVQGYRLSGDDGLYISTKTEGKKFIKLKPNENVLQVLSSTPSFY